MMWCPLSVPFFLPSLLCSTPGGPLEKSTERRKESLPGAVRFVRVPPKSEVNCPFPVPGRFLFQSVSICAGSVRIVVEWDCIKVHGLCAPKRSIGSHFDGHIQERSHGRTWRRHSSVEASARCQNRSSACHSTRAGCRWGAFACTLSVTAKATAHETAVAYRLMLWPDLPR